MLRKSAGQRVPASLRQQIFEPFVTTKQAASGTGLGLFVCRNIINALGGQISVHDAPGGGALFRVVLPAAGTPLESPSPPPALEPGRLGDNRRRRILIIDDDPVVARALASAFHPDLFEVHTVLDGREGFELLLARDDLDLTYCDVMMKDFTGVDLYEELQRRSPERLSRVVFMTGGAFTARSQAFVEQRRDGCMQKPFDIVADALRRLG